LPELPHTPLISYDVPLPMLLQPLLLLIDVVVLDVVGITDVDVEDVIALEVPNQVGQLYQVAKKIAAAGIYIHYIYGSPAKGKMTLIFKTENDKKALKALQK
jgi:hypothetical protein